MSPRRVLLLATNKLLRICRVGESPDRALFKLHRVPGITLSSRNRPIRGPKRGCYMVGRPERASILKVYFLPAEEPGIYRECPGSNERQRASHGPEQNAGIRIVMFNHDPEDGKRDHEKSHNGSP